MALVNGWWLLVAYCLGVATYWLATRGEKKHALFLQERLRDSEKTIVSLVDRLQAPTTKEYVARVNAQADAEDRRAMPPPEREKAKFEALFDDIMNNELWRSNPVFDGMELTPDPDGGGVIAQGGWDDLTQMPVIQKLTRAQVVDAFRR